jgi:internalin A
MSEQGSGLEIALQRIEKEAQERTDFLDLGRLGLTELPEDLFRLTHLRRLKLGRDFRARLIEHNPSRT